MGNKKFNARKFPIACQKTSWLSEEIEIDTILKFQGCPKTVVLL